MEKWLSKFGQVVAYNDLKLPGAIELVSFMCRHGIDIANLIEIRSGDYGEIVVFDCRTGRPQDSVYPIKPVERIGVVFRNIDKMPLIYVLRTDFPDTEHQNLTPKDAPRSICIDDRPWVEARLTWTPVELFHRILSWFSRAAHGELHDPRQPLDPLYFSFPLCIVNFSRDLLRKTNQFIFLDAYGSFDCRIFDFRQAQKVHEIKQQATPICLVTYHIRPEQMKRLEFPPFDLVTLANLLKRSDIDLFEDLRTWCSRLILDPSLSYQHAESFLVVVLDMPILAPNGAPQDGTDLRAYFTKKTIGQIAVSLGVALEEKSGEKSGIKYVKSLITQNIDLDLARKIEVFPGEVHYSFDRKLAVKVSDGRKEDRRKAVLVGAGAIGSHVADCLVREGRFFWTIIDDDCILPHNLTRHIARGDDITKNKAICLAEKLKATLEESEVLANGISANVMDETSIREEIDKALNQADLIIDATASVPAERYLSDHVARGRRITIFLNPAGNAAVLLAEPEDRSITLRDFEAQYLNLILHNEEFAKHLSPPSENYVYTGACQAITNLIPESRVMTLSGLLAGELGMIVDRCAAKMKIWSLNDAGQVDIYEHPAQLVRRICVRQWTITIDRGLLNCIQNMRIASLPEETGGILVGIADIPEKQIHLVGVTPAPVDSKASTTEFERGTSGVQQYLKCVDKRTLGQVRYIGEWHSHTYGVSTSPSLTDRSQYDWLTGIFETSNSPVLMLIVGDHEVSVSLAGTQSKPSKISTTMLPMYNGSAES